MRVFLLALPLWLTAAASAGDQAPFVYPIWDQDNFVEAYEKTVLRNQVILGLGCALALSMLGVVVFGAVKRRERFRFSLRWMLAFVFALSVALFGGVGWWQAQKPDAGDARFHAAVEAMLAKPFSVDVGDNELPWLSWVVEDLRNRAVPMVLSPELAGVKGKAGLKLTDVPTRDAINRICGLTGTGCDVRNGVLFFYPEGHRPPIRKRLQPRQAWETEVAKKLSRRMSFCFVDTPMSEAVVFLAGLTGGVKIRTDPRVQAENVQLNMPSFNDVRMDDALTWFCFLSGAEWTLRKTDDGAGEIWISPCATKR